MTSKEQLRFEVRPGITGWAQVNGRNASSWDERLAHDAWYVENRSLILDLKIIFTTVKQALKGEGVHVDPGNHMLNLDEERSDRGPRRDV